MENVLTGRVVAAEFEKGIAVIQTGGCQIVVPSSETQVGARVTFAIPADDIIVSREPVSRTSARNLLVGEVKNILRDEGKAELIVACGVDLKVTVTEQAVEALELAPGAGVFLLIKANACHILP
jgi:molybdopterin-binding protein